MKILFSILLLLFQAEPVPNKWECLDDSQPLTKEQLTRVKPSELRERVVACAVPRLPGAFDGVGSVLIEVEVDEAGNVRCARVLSKGQHPIIQRAALGAAKQWKFEPLEVNGKAQPYAGILILRVTWDTKEAGKQCPKEKRRA